MRSEPVALLDACVLVQAALRDTLLRLAEEPRLYKPLWSEEIILEMKRALQRQIGLTGSQTAYLERELRRHFPDAWVDDFAPMVSRMTNDSKDRHVLAAAAHGRASYLVTFNKRHFPSASTSPWNVKAIGPSAFLELLYRSSPSVIVERLNEQAANLGRSLDVQLEVLALAVPAFVEVVRKGLKS